MLDPEIWKQSYNSVIPVLTGLKAIFCLTLCGQLRTYKTAICLFLRYENSLSTYGKD